MMSAATLTLIPGSAMAKRASSQSVRRPKASATASAMASLELLARARSGDANALNDLCARYLPRMQKWAHGRLPAWARGALDTHRSEEHTSELQSRPHIVCRLLLEK